MAGVDLSLPVAPPPPGVIPNFTNPPNQSVLAYSCIVVAFATLTFFAWFRFVVKYCIVKMVHVEDYITPFAWLAAAGHFICGFLTYDFAPIIHSWDMRLITLGRFLLLLRISSCLFNISMLLIKCQMLIQVLRAFVPRGTHSKTHWILHVLMVSNAIFHTAIAFLLILSCKPISKAWHPWEEGKCFPVSVLTTTSAVMNLISELSILCVTQWVVWTVVRVDGWKRLRLSVSFLAGIVPCAFSSICLYYIYRGHHSSDLVHNVALMNLACYGELSSAMFVLFLPVIPKFFSRLKCKLLPNKPTSPSHPNPRSKPKPAPKSRFRFTPNHKLTNTTLSFADIGIDGKGGAHASASLQIPKTWAWKNSIGARTQKSLWHISYTQRGGEDGFGEAFWRDVRKGERGFEGEGGFGEEKNLKRVLFDEGTVEGEGLEEGRGEGVWEKEWGKRSSSVYSQ